MHFTGILNSIIDLGSVTSFIFGMASFVVIIITIRCIFKIFMTDHVSEHNTLFGYLANLPGNFNCGIVISIWHLPETHIYTLLRRKHFCEQWNCAEKYRYEWNEWTRKWWKERIGHKPLPMLLIIRIRPTMTRVKMNRNLNQAIRLQVIQTFRFILPHKSFDSTHRNLLHHFTWQKNAFFDYFFFKMPTIHSSPWRVFAIRIVLLIFTLEYSIRIELNCHCSYPGDEIKERPEVADKQSTLDDVE